MMAFSEKGEKRGQAHSKRDEALQRAASVFESRIIPAFKGRDAALDPGTGNGFTALALGRHFSRVVSIDVEGGLADKARAKAEPDGVSNVTFREMDAHQLEYPGGRFDAVTCRAAIHHFANPGVVLKEVRRVLRANGLFVVMDFCFSERTKGALTPLSMMRESDFARYYTFQDFCDLFDDNDFLIEAIYTYTLPRLVSEWLAIAPTAVQPGLRRAFDSLDARVPAELRLRELDADREMTYRIIEFVNSKKGPEVAGPNSIVPSGSGAR